jgi:hypothetical protein
MLIIVAVVYCAARSTAFVKTLSTGPIVYPDTSGYEYAARLPLLGLDFLTWWKPWGLPLLYRFLPGTTGSVVRPVQFAVSLAAWLALALVLRSAVRDRSVLAVVVTVMLTFSLIPIVAQWDGVLLSESLSLSVAVGFLASTLWLASKPTGMRCAIVLAVALAAAGLRDTNAVLVVVTLVPLGIACSRHIASRRLGVVLAVGALVIGGLTYASQNPRRWQAPLAVVIAGRVLNDRTATAYFVARGMPVYPGLADDIYASRSTELGFVSSPRVEPFLSWLAADGQRVYRDYQLSHLDYTIGQPVQQLDSMAAPQRSLPNGLDFFRPAGFKSLLPVPLQNVLYWTSGWFVVAVALVVLLGVAVLAAAGVYRRLWLAPWLILASTFVHAIVVWNSDWTELARHSLTLAVTARLSMLVLVALVADELLVRRRSRALEVA